MDFKDQIKLLSERVIKLKDNICTEEATKTSFVLPFLQALGYDVFDPMEVVPEFTCDVGIKKGEKIDYAVVYRFYTDLVETNKMDEKPFFEFNMERYRASEVDKLREFHKSYFNIDSILNTASELKFTNEIRNAIVREVSEPTDEFVKYFARPVYPGRFTDAILEQFRSIVKQAFMQYTNDYMNERLKSAISGNAVVESKDAEPKPAAEESADSGAELDEPRIVTTEEELQGFYIVRAILCNTVDLDRVVERDAQSYFAILFDDNNRKPICRLHFNTGNKYVETFDENKVGTKHRIESLNDIYKLSEQLVTVVKYYIEQAG